MKSRQALSTLAVLFAFGTIWFAPELFSKLAAPDEVAYFDGFQLRLDGASPYGAPRYIYTPVFARVGAFATLHLGLHGAAVLLRLVNLAAACLLAWGAFALAPSLGRARLPLAALSLVLLRPLTTSLALGNLSPVAAASTLAGVAMAASMPVLSGLVLGLGLAVKPTGLPALLILGAFAVRRRSRAHAVAITVTLAVLLPLLAVDASLLPAMLGRSRELPDASTNLSPHRLLALFGVDLPAAAFAAIVTLPCAVWAWVMPVSMSGLAMIAGLASVVWLPRVWEHSFVFLLPAMAVAIDAAVTTLRSTQGAEPAIRQRALLVATWTLLGITCLEIADAWGDLARVFGSLPWNPALNTAIPLLAAIQLTRTGVRNAP